MLRDAAVEVVERVGPPFGLTPTAVVALGFFAFSTATAIYKHITRFDDGYDAAIEAMRTGNVELEGKIVRIMTEADEAALEAYQRGQDEKDRYIEDQTDRIDRLTEIIGRHSYNIQNPERYYAPETDWGSTKLPAHGRLRYDTIKRERRSGGSSGPGRTTDNRYPLIGGPTVDANPADIGP